LHLWRADSVRRAVGWLDTTEPGEPLDLLVDIAAELPMQAICILLGVPEDDRHMLRELADQVFDIKEGDAGGGAGMAGLLEYGVDLIEAKRKQPTDDMLSTVVHA